MTDASPHRAWPGDATGAERLAEILRVDHAGEYGAVRIYEGQLAVLGNAPAGAAIRRSSKRSGSERRRSSLARSVSSAIFRSVMSWSVPFTDTTRPVSSRLARPRLEIQMVRPSGRMTRKSLINSATSPRMTGSIFAKFDTRSSGWTTAANDSKW